MSNRGLSYTNKFDLSGKIAFVTGGTGILGVHFCNGLAEAGAHVVIADIDGEKASDSAKQLAMLHNVECVGLECDVRKTDSVRAAVADSLKHFGQIDILHNNAASKSANLDKFFEAFEEYDLAEWREIMATNIDGMFLVAQCVGRHMAERNRGSIIQTSSIYGVFGPDQRIYENSVYEGRPINTPAVYSVSKAAVIGLTRYLAPYRADKGIRVNTLTPGGMESGQNSEFKDRYSARVPLRRMGQPEELVPALLFLASDASSYVTGQNILVDGGLSAW